MPGPDPLTQIGWVVAALLGLLVLLCLSSSARRRATPNPKLICCPHCQTRGAVTASDVVQKVGISGAKVTAALFTGGFSLLGTGLSRKEKRTAMSCEACGMKWLV